MHRRLFCRVQQVRREETGHAITLILCTLPDVYFHLMIPYSRLLCKMKRKNVSMKKIFGGKDCDLKIKMNVKIQKG